MPALRLLTLPLRRWYVLLPCWAAAAGVFVLTEALASSSRFHAIGQVAPRWSAGGETFQARLEARDPTPGPGASDPATTARRSSSPQVWEIVSTGVTAAEALNAASDATSSLEADLQVRVESLLSRRGVELTSRQRQRENERALLVRALAMASADEATSTQALLDTATRDLHHLELIEQRLNGTKPAEYIDQKIRIVPAPGTVPVKPERRFLPIALLGSAVVLLSLMAAGLVDANDTRFRSPLEAQRRLRLPLLGAIPTLESAGNEPPASPQQLGSLESFAKLAERVQEVIAEGNLRSLTVASARDGEGKTTVAMGLATALAERGLRVILIEGNLLQPSLQTHFHLESERGLGDLLESVSFSHESAVDIFGALSEAALAEFVRPVDGNRLRIVCAGDIKSPIPLLLDRRKLQPLLLRLARVADIVLCDSRSLLSSGDALSFATVTDGAVLVVRANRTEGRDVAWARQLLQQAQVTTLGFILNHCASKQAQRWQSSRADQPNNNVTEEAV